MTKILNSIQSENTAVADFFQVAIITLAGAVTFLTVASTF